MVSRSRVPSAKASEEWLTCDSDHDRLEASCWGLNFYPHARSNKAGVRAFVSIAIFGTLFNLAQQCVVDDQNGRKRMNANDIVKLGLGYGAFFSLATSMAITALLWAGAVKLKEKSQIHKLMYLNVVPLVVLVIGFVMGWMRLDSVGIERGIRTEAMTAAQVDSSPPYYGDGYRGNLRPPMEAYLRAFVVPEESKAAEELKKLFAMIDQRRYPDEPLEFFNADEEFKASVDVFRHRMRTYVSSGTWPEK
jgi:hypothetical protein